MPHIDHIDKELDLARRDGPARQLHIPPCPELLTRLQDAMSRDDPDWDEVRDIAQADVAMAASLVRTANSPMYARSAPVQSVEQAMSLLGLKQSAALLTQFLTARALPVNHPALEHFWDSSTRRALAMGYIARQLYGVAPDLAHTCGLFCNVGIPILLQGMRGYAGTLAEASARRDQSFTDTENAAHQTDHTIVGALVARAWRLDPRLKLAIRLHHDADALHSQQVPAEVRSLVAMSMVAEHLVHQHEEHPDLPEWEWHGAAALDLLQVKVEELPHWQDGLHDAFQQVF